MSTSPSGQGADGKRVLACCLAVLVIGLGMQAGLGVTLQQAPHPPANSQPALKSSADDSARQITVFVIQAVPGPSTIDPRLGSIRNELRKVLPEHGFRLLAVAIKRLALNQAVTCKLERGYKAETVLVNPSDDAGKVHLRCVLSKDGKPEFSTLVKNPVNQLFFYERSLDDGTRVIIGVGARDIMKVDAPAS